ncbi:ABC transporter permease [Streptomyces sp. 7-21]|uniref:ABC transporter permease n=1 Tax=Streptomyces sp. 7-21 TaxID=2802283 RepID=UPI00191DBB33|nr:ABC transporter permease [Streptomyces sp. 7-21]MBL1068349.1 ABC transporter permease [Streptomyces sp. 7-21]
MTAPAPAPAAAPPRPAPPPAAARRPRRRAAALWLLLPALLWLALFFVAPVVYQASTSLQTGSLEEGYEVTWHVATYADALEQYGEHFLRSFLYAAAATLLCVVIGYPVAYLIAVRAGRWRPLLLVLVIAPFFTSFLIRTMAWRTILSDNGPVVALLDRLRVLDVTAWLGLTTDDRVLATPLAVICGLTYNFLPFMILPLYASLERLDPSLREAARDLYATGSVTFRTVTLPLSMPGLAAGTLLTFIPASGDYINAQLLGSPSEQMVGNAIQRQFLHVLDYPTAAAMSFLLMAVILLAVSVYIRRAGTEELAR